MSNIAKKVMNFCLSNQREKEVIFSPKLESFWNHWLEDVSEKGISRVIGNIKSSMSSSEKLIVVNWMENRAD